MSITCVRYLLTALAQESHYQQNIGRPGFDDYFDRHREVGDRIHGTDGVATLRLHHTASGVTVSFREWIRQEVAKLAIDRGCKADKVERMGVAEFASAVCGGHGAESDVPVYLGQGRFSAGNRTICLDGIQAETLDFLVERRAANLKDIKDSTTCTNPSATLRLIRETHIELAPYINLPGRKSKGGYSTSIVDGRKQA